MNNETSLFDKIKETGKHGVVFGIGSTLQRVVAFVLIPVYTTRLTVAEYGILGLVLITGEVLRSVFSLGLLNAVIRSYYDYENVEDREIVISTAFFLTIFSCAILFILGIFNTRILSLLIFKDTRYDFLLFLLIIITVLQIFKELPVAVIRAQKKSLLFIIIQVSTTIIGISLICYFVISRDMGVTGVLWGMASMYLIAGIVLYFSIGKYISFSFSKIEAIKMLKYGIPLIPASLSAFIYISFNRYILQHYSNLHEVGLYNLGFQFGMIINVMLVIPIAFVWPAMYLSVKEQKSAKDFYSRVLTYIAFIGLFLFLGVALLSREVIALVSNEEYWMAYTIIPLIALSYTFLAVQAILNVGVGIKRKTKHVTLYTFVGAVTNLVLSFLLIPDYGMMGTAYATLISFIVMLVMVYFINQRLYKIVYEWNRILKIVLASIFIFSLGYFVKIDHKFISMAFKTGVILTLPIILYFTGFYTFHEKRRAKQFLRFVLVKSKIK
jgi:O-antigen/teichoic acid export membrane protein